MARRFNPFVEGGKLTPQQTEVVRRMAIGESTGEVALAMGVSDKTVEYHRAEAYKRIGVDCVADLTHWALAVGLVQNKFQSENIVSMDDTETEAAPARPDWTKVYRTASAQVVGIPKVTHGFDRHGQAL